MRLTEFLYGGNNSEFIEFTNVHNAPLDVNGRSLDDDSRVPGTFALGACGIVQADQSVLMTNARKRISAPRGRFAVLSASSATTALASVAPMKSMCAMAM